MRIEPVTLFTEIMLTNRRSGDRCRNFREGSAFWNALGEVSAQ
jgi:hypothetical protein